MTHRSTAKKHKVVAYALSFALTAGAVTPAFADNASSGTQKAVDALTERVEQSMQAYQDAEAALDELNSQIADNEAKAAELEATLPAQRARAAQSIKELYKLQQSTPDLIDLILSSADLNDFISTFHYIDTVVQRNTKEIQSLSAMQDQLVQTQTELTVQRDEAVNKQEATRVALDEARSVHEEAQQRADLIAQRESEDRAKAVQAAQKAIENAASGTQQPAASTQAAIPAAPAQPTTEAAPTATPEPTTSTTSTTETAPSTPEPTPAAEESTPTVTSTPEATITTVSGNTAVVEVPESESANTEPIAENTTSDEVNSWADRLNAYLDGTALAGYGDEFAEAAAEYGVDPRLAAAISGVESGWGQVCFRDHNAWGWGQSGWDSWEEAIDSYTKGFSSLYGSTITLEGAEMYASNDIYEEWYSIVLSEMERI